jgi:hypothetical protein
MYRTDASGSIRENVAPGWCKPRTLMADGGGVYWFVREQRKLLGLDRGGEVRVLANLDVEPTALAINRLDVFWIGLSRLRVSSRSGGEVRDIAAMSAVALAATDTAVYASGEDGLLRVWLDSGKVERLAARGGLGVAAGDDFVVWFSGLGNTCGTPPGANPEEYCGEGGDSLMIWREHSQPTPLAPTGIPTVLKARGAYAYWIDGGVVMQTCVGGGTLVLHRQGTAVDVDADASGVYWANSRGELFKSMPH